MKHRNARALFIWVAAISVAMLLPSVAAGHHLANDVPDNSNPDTTSRNGQICSASSVPVSGGDYSQVINGWTYWLRYSTNCRSVWARSSNNATRRSDMVTKRIPDSNWGGFCTGNTHFSGDTWYWTGQVDDAAHQSRVRVDNSGHDCSGAATWVSDAF